MNNKYVWFFWYHVQRVFPFNKELPRVTTEGTTAFVNVTCYVVIMHSCMFKISATVLATSFLHSVTPTNGSLYFRRFTLFNTYSRTRALRLSVLPETEDTWLRVGRVNEGR